MIGVVDIQDRITGLDRHAIGHSDGGAVAVYREIVGVRDRQAPGHDIRMTSFEVESAAVRSDVVQGGLDRSRIVCPAIAGSAKLRNIDNWSRTDGDRLEYRQIESNGACRHCSPHYN